MSDCFVGEIRMFAGNYAPPNWALCDGRLLPIEDYQMLYALIGASYGGDQVTNFKLPDLRGRVPLHMGRGPGLSNRPIATTCGVEKVALNLDQIPAHTHLVNVGGAGTTGKSAGNYPADSVGFKLYSAKDCDSTMNQEAVSYAKSNGDAHANLMPALCINFIIALKGYFPQKS